MAFVSTVSMGERRDLDVSKQIALYIPDATPFAVMLMRARKEVTQTARFSWWDQQIAGWWSQVAANESTAGGDTITVTDVSVFKPKDIVKVTSTGEIMLVNEIVDTDESKAIKVVREYGTTKIPKTDGTNKDILKKDDYLLRLGNAMEQFSTAPESRIVQPVNVWNTTQIFRRPFDQSMTSSAESLKTVESERNRLRKEQAIYHRMDIERAMIFGERKEDQNSLRQTTGGLLSFIGHNYVNATNGLNEDVLESFCEKLFQYGSDKKILLCSRRTGSIINSFARDRIDTTSGEETYGLRLKTYKSFHGDLYIVPSKTLEKDYQGLAIGVDMSNVSYRPLAGRDTKLKMNIQANDADGWRDEYLTEAGLQVRLPETHCVLLNAASAAERLPDVFIENLIVGEPTP